MLAFAGNAILSEEEGQNARGKSATRRGVEATSQRGPGDRMEPFRNRQRTASLAGLRRLSLSMAHLFPRRIASVDNSKEIQFMNTIRQIFSNP